LHSFHDSYSDYRKQKAACEPTGDGFLLDQEDGFAINQVVDGDFFNQSNISSVDWYS
jgi:hypothetical protein